MKYTIVNLISELNKNISAEDLGEILYGKSEEVFKNIPLKEDTDIPVLDYRSYVPKDFTCIPGEEKLIDEIVSNTLKKCNAVLPIEEMIILVLPTFDSFVIDEMNGCVGFSPFAGKSMILSLNTNTPGWAPALEYTIAHEYHHVIIHSKDDWESLGDTLVYEGMAENFRGDIVGRANPPYVTYNSKETCLQYWQTLQPYLEDTSEELYTQVFFGGGEYPQWLGYSLGDLLIERYQQKYNESWKELSFRKPKEVIDFIIVSESEVHSTFTNIQTSRNKTTHYVSDGVQNSLFDLLDTEEPAYTPSIQKVNKIYFSPSERTKSGHFRLQNRRFLGNKYKLLGFIEDIANEKCNGFSVFCDIFAGSGVVGERFNEKNIKVISNDLLSCNYTPLKAFLGISKINLSEVEKKINQLNELEAAEDNYFSNHFGNTYFSLDNARKIGAIREKIEEIASDENEKAVLVTSLLYAVDKVANTVGHYDAFRRKLDTIQPIRLLVPDFEPENNENNEIYKEDANQLIRKISCDVLYIDPPYNSRQYSDAYHLLENLTTWEKPPVQGKAKKMDRSHLKSDYCLQSAPKAFADLISNADCKHILVSYNNTEEKKDGRSNARISDEQIINALKARGKVEIFERDYKAFTTGRSDTDGHTERVFYCKVND